jgi:hypothetical protein
LIFHISIFYTCYQSLKQIFISKTFKLFLQAKRKTLFTKAEKLHLSRVDVRERKGSFFTDCPAASEKSHSSLLKKGRKLNRKYPKREKNTVGYKEKPYFCLIKLIKNDSY